MSGDDTHRPVHGTAAGDPYVALPPTAVDASASGPTRLIVAWPGFDPPRTGRALAAAIPMTGVPVWRVYLDLPRESPGGLESGAILRNEAIEAYGAAVEEAVERLPSALADIRRDLGLPDGPVGLAGFSVGGAAALLAAARGAVPVTTVAVVAPVIAPSRAARAVEKRSALDRSWTDDAHRLADRLDLGGVAPDLAGRGVAALLIGGSKDRVVPARDITALRDELRRHDAGPVESTAFRMGHALAAEPGVDAHPPITEAVRVDGVLTDWFRERLASPSGDPQTTAMDVDQAALDAGAALGDSEAAPSGDPQATAVDMGQARQDAAAALEASEAAPSPSGDPQATAVDMDQAVRAAGAAPEDPEAAASPSGGNGHGAWSLESGGAPPEAPQTPETRSAGAGSMR